MAGFIPVIFPSVSTFLTFASSEEVEFTVPPISLENCKSFNKYSICGPNNLQKLIIPVNENGKETQIADLTINYSVKWIREHKNALQTAYGKSPFYEFYDYRFFALFDTQFEKLIDLNMAIWQQLCREFHVHENSNPLVNSEMPNHVDTTEIPVYPQVFADRHGFQSNVSCLDLLFNLGPLSHDYIKTSL